jgi:hypothetical protein
VIHAIFPASLGIVVSPRCELARAVLNVFACVRAREECMVAIVLNDTDELSVGATDGLWLSADDAARVTGWTLKPEGMRRDEFCVPLRAGSVRDGRVGRPVAHDAANETWVLGAGADQRNAAMAGLTAPDFTLPDLAGVPHTLSALRGNKVFLATWASW